MLQTIDIVTNSKIIITYDILGDCVQILSNKYSENIFAFIICSFYHIRYLLSMDQYFFEIKGLIIK